MPGPTLIDLQTQGQILLNQNSLNVINHHEVGNLEEASIDLTFTLKGKGELLPEVKP